MCHSCPDAIKCEPVKNNQDKRIVRVYFADGKIRDCDMTEHIKQHKIFHKMLNPYFFALVKAIDGAVVWPDELDFAPEFFYFDIGEDIKS